MADLLVTDPPYNVNYANIKASVMKALHHRTDGKTISNDNFKDDSEFQQFLIDSLGNANDALKDGGVFYIWHADSQAFSFWEATHQIGWTIREILNWVKDRLSMGRQDYQWIHEPCLYGWKSGAGHYFVDVRNLTTVFDDERPIDELSNKELKGLVANYRQAVPTSIIRENKPSKSEEHPTMKPVKLIARLIGNSSREGELILDIFGGSGTTMIAAEQLNRRCYMMELDPHYADVIIERWQNLTGRKAEKIR